MHPILQFLRRRGRELLWRRIGRLSVQAATAIFAYLFLYLCAVWLIRSLSLTLPGLLWLPAIILSAWLVLLPWQWWQLRNHRKVAAFLEAREPSLGLKLRSCLDFLSGKSDQTASEFQHAYLDQVADQLASFHPSEPKRLPWGRLAGAAFAANLVLWFVAGDALRKKYYNPGLNFGKTHLNLAEGSITIFEPDYTQIPGRTLPLKGGTFQAYPGSRIRFMLTLPPGTPSVHVVGKQTQEPIPLRIEEGQVTHEFVLLESDEMWFALGSGKAGGQTERYVFDLKTDQVPELNLRSHTPEGMLNVLDPLMLEVEIKDDFGINELEAVIAWENGEKRQKLNVPSNRRNHFISRNQWFLSDLQVEDVASFTVYLEAKDNNPINGPGIGRSESLTYELESPDKKYDEFMELARELLDTMTHSLGDNLETQLGQLRPANYNLNEAERMSRQIRSGLYRSLDLTNILLAKLRETPNITQLDQNFLFKFRDGVSRQARSRTEMGYLFQAVMASANTSRHYRQLRSQHNKEENRLEQLTYELLLQLKMWAVLELERQNNQLQDQMDQMQELLENSENMDQQELMEMFQKLMQEVMKQFNKMMEQAANQMDMSVEEFMNSDSMELSENQMDDLMKEIMEALKNGDMEKAKELMEQFRSQMAQASESMQQAMGQMSPEMMEMMAQMREFMGLLRELKREEEDLLRQSQDLKREIDKQMGGNEAGLDPQQQKQQEDLLERIRKRLTKLNDELVHYKTEELSEQIIQKITDAKGLLEGDTLDPLQKEDLRDDLSRMERALDFISKDGVEQLKEAALNSLETTEQMKEYLDQGELLLALETGLKLEKKLHRGERVSERSDAEHTMEDVRPSEQFSESRTDLYAILEALQNLKHQRENQRTQFMQEQQETRQQKLSKRQQDISKMIEEFKKKAEESLGESPLFRKLDDIDLSMRNAERKLNGSRMGGAVQYEQQAIQQIGELLEQMQQAQQPNQGQGSPMQMTFGRDRDGWDGDPTRDFYIPDSQKQLSKDQIKEAIRKQLEKNLPDSYSKDIRKYYEKLMDQ